MRASENQSWVRIRALWPRAARILLVLAVAAAVTGLSALAFGCERHNQRVVLPEPAGPYAVGRAVFEWVDESRPEVFTPDPSDRRELAVWVSYPMSADGSGERAPYLPGAWRAAVERSRGFLASFVTQNLAEVEPHAEDDGSVALSQPSYPVILLQPGLGPSHPDYTTLAEDLASRGYIVVASTPTYSARVVAFSDGRVAEQQDTATVADSASPAEAKTRLDKLVGVWAADEVFLMNRLDRLNTGDSDGRFTGRLNLDAVGVMGHSFGGASAAETCHLDHRCKAGADLDGSPYGSVILSGLQQPFLFVWSEPSLMQRGADEQSRRDTQTIRSRSSGHILELTIRGTRHFNFADYAVLYEPLLKPLQMLGAIDGRRGLGIVTTYVAAFFDQYLKNVPQPLLRGPSSSYPEVQVAAP